MGGMEIGWEKLQRSHLMRLIEILLILATTGGRPSITHFPPNILHKFYKQRLFTLSPEAYMVQDAMVSASYRR